MIDSQGRRATECQSVNLSLFDSHTPKQPAESVGSVYFTAIYVSNNKGTILKILESLRFVLIDEGEKTRKGENPVSIPEKY